MRYLIIFALFALFPLLTYGQIIKSSAIMELNNMDYTAPCASCSDWRFSRVDNKLYRWTNSQWQPQDLSLTNEIQTLSISNDTIYLSNGGFVKVPTQSGNQGSIAYWASQDSLGSLVVGGNLSVVNDTLLSLLDSTRLVQDSVLVYYQNGQEVGRDTIAIPAMALIDSTRIISDSVAVYYQGGIEVGRDTIRTTASLNAVFDNYTIVGVPYRVDTSIIVSHAQATNYSMDIRVNSTWYDLTMDTLSDEGRLEYNATNGTLQFGMDRNVPMEVGQSLYNEPMVNKTGVLLIKGTVLMVDTSQYTQGSRLRVMPADASLPPDLLLGIAAEDIQINQEGFVVWFGNLTGNLSILQPVGETWVQGDLLYPHPTQNGRLTNVLPFNGKIKIPIAVIKDINGNNVLIKVRMRVGEYLRNITDVDLTSPVNGSNLFYENGLWKDTLYSYLDSIVFNVPTYMSVTPTVLSTSDTVTLGFQPQSSNTFFAGPTSGPNAPPAFRTLSQADINTAGGITGLGAFGLIPYHTGLYTQATNADFKWDTTTRSMIIGNLSVPQARLTVRGDNTTQSLLSLRSSTGNVFSVTPSLVTVSNDMVFRPNTSQGSIRFSGTNETRVNFGDGQTNTSTAGDFSMIEVDRSFAPTSGTATHTSISLFPYIDQTGGANGATRGLLVSPTIANAASWRSIEWTNDTGWGLYSAGLAKNYIAGNVGIGTVSLHPSALLTLKSNNQGILVPRMTTTEKNNIQGPETSLLLFDTDVNNYQYYDGSAWVGIVPTSQQEAMIIAASDETTNLATLVAARTFRAPYALTIWAVKVDVNTAPTGASILVDLNNGANSVLTTRAEIEANEFTSLDATTQPVLNSTYTSVAANAVLTVDIDQVGSTIAGKGLKITIYYTRI